MFPNCRYAGIILALAAVTSATIAQTGQTVQVNGIDYYVAPSSVNIIDLTADDISSALRGEDIDLVPLTVLGDSSKSFTSAEFISLVNNYTATDDVFNTGFLQSKSAQKKSHSLANHFPAVFVTHIGSGSAHAQPLGGTLHDFGTQLIMFDRPYGSSQSVTGWRKSIPPGPYFMSASTGNVFQAYRLYSDVQGAFTEGVIADGDGTYSTLSAAISGAQSQTIGVPSRLYYTKTAAQPLAGVRFGIKDIYDIAGLKSGLGNRAYFDLYPPRTVSGTAVSRLIAAGAIIIGKMKTSQFANGETATDDWVDYHSPYNPRGDGYQDPSSSSSGPGAGIGAYEFLDIALGSDTGGSIRGPSQVNGCFGNRPSHGLVALDGVMPLSPDMDTAGFLTRDPLLWHTAAQVLYETNISSSNFKSFPKKILTSGFPTSPTTEAEGVLLDFLAKLQKFLGTTNTTALNLNTLWAGTEHAPINDPIISDVMSNVYPVLIGSEQFNIFTTPFYADYAAAHEGRRPFIDPVPLIRWAFGTSFGPNAADLANANRTVFKSWWETVVNPPSTKTCSDSILLYPGSLAQTTYRNAYRS